MAEERPDETWKNRLYVVIYKADTPTGKAFDVILLVLILLSVTTVMLESVEEYRRLYGSTLIRLEWGFTIAFTIEYFLRILAVRRPAHYMASGWGIVDLIAILPTYMSLLFPGAQALLVFRGLRLVRIFRVFKLARFVGEGNILGQALLASQAKITVFLFWLVMIISVIATIMYLIESPEAGFTSIPISIYWAIVTMTTVGYGDIVPQTAIGKALASALMIIGYSIIAVPTGIVTAELGQLALRRGDIPESAPPPPSKRYCPSCNQPTNEDKAIYCWHCGEKL